MAVQLKMTLNWDRQPGLNIPLMVLIIGLWPAVICEEKLCNNNEVINGGWIKWPENRVARSVMTYICPVGFRPYPVSWRYCRTNNEWSRLRNAYGETALQASCQEITCLAPQSFDFGFFNPAETIYKVNESISFHCYNGFKMVGSASRTCLPNGQWTGNVPRCSTLSSFCINPGIPFGSKRTGNSFDIFSTVQYHCGVNILRGSSKRKCLESGSWSGVEPRCENRYAFDNVKDLAKELDILETTIRSADLSSRNEYRTRFDVFFVIDVSGSLGNENFIKSVDFVTTFINRVSGVYGVVRFEFIAFGSYSFIITDIKEMLTPEMVIERIKGVKYRDHYNNTGRRTGVALEIVHSTINKTLHLQAKSRQPVPKQVIIIITHGPYNGAPSPFLVTKKISDLLSHLPNSLDIYAIGIGEIQKNYLESLVPMKETIAHGQRYVFYFPSYDYLEEVHEKLKKNNNVQTFDCGIRGNLTQRPVGRIFGGLKSKEYDWPWQVNIQFGNKEFCGGSIISTRWILSAAHCFNDTMGMTSNIKIWTGSIRRKNGLQKLSVEEVILHENFSRPTEMNNDIALLKVNETIIYSSHVRPVCLPCTKRSAQLLASSMGNWDEACHYEDVILTSDGGKKESITSGYVTGWGYYMKGSKSSSIDLLHAQVFIQNRLTCASPFPLTENMFCANGPKADSCKGDSGGPLVTERNNRWIQVGIVSFGRMTVCGENFMGFYINVAKMMGWIKERVPELE